MSRFALVGLIGGLASACSTEATRLSDVSFSNPFSSSQRAAEPAMTGSVSAAPTAPARAAPLAAPVTSQPLAAPVASQPLAVARAVPAAPVQPITPTKPSAATATARGPAGWSATGGTTVTVGAGDTLGTIADRYGVPGSAILQANGLSSPAQIASGRRIVIPVYNAAGAAALSSQKVASLTPIAPAAAPRPLAPPTASASPKLRFVEGPKAAAVREPEVAEPPKRKVRPGQASARQLAETKAAAAPAKPAKPEPAAKSAKPEPAKPEPAKLAKAEPAKPVRAESQKLAKAEAAKPEPQKLAKAEAVKPAKEPAKVESPKPAKVDAPKLAKVEPPAPAKTPEPAKVAAAAPAPKPEPAKPAPKEPEQTASVPETFRWPAKGRVIAGFGSGGGNEGINIAVPEGTPVKAAEDGVVTYAGSEVKGYGKLVLIKHDNGYVSAYAHNGDIAVKSGEKVRRGQVVAKSGQSGNVTSPQLHFELRKGATPVDPIVHLASN